METEKSFLNPETEIKQEVVPESKNERVEIGNFVLEPVDREANKFHFLSNLAEWHRSCSREDNKVWEKEVGGFSEEEKEAIENFGKIMNKQDSQFGKDGLTTIYTTSEDQEQRNQGMDRAVALKDREVMERCLSVIENPFSRVWEKNEPRLLGARREFVENLKNFEISGKKEQLENDLNNFFGKPERENQLKIFFLMQERLGSGGTAFPESGAITMQRLDTAPSLSVLYHEMMHAKWQADPSYQKLFAEAVKSVDMKSVDKKTMDGVTKMGLDAPQIINEVITDSFLPHGCLEKYFLKELPSAPGPTQDRSDMVATERLRRFLSPDVVPLSEKYIQEGRRADEDYFQETIKIILSSIKQFKF